jgi:methyl-accepting chemotaxis protein
MARVKGRDLLLDMMDTLAKLEASSEAYALQMEEIARMGLETRAIVTGLSSDMRRLSATVGSLSATVGTLSATSRSLSASVDTLSATVGSLSATVGSLSATVGSLSETVGSITARVGSLEEEVGNLSAGFVKAAAGSRTNQQHVATLARIFNEYAGQSTDRIERLEDRVGKLERKAG